MDTPGYLIGGAGGVTPLEGVYISVIRERDINRGRDQLEEISCL